MKLHINTINLFVFGIGIILSQFYIFSSGVPQPGHIILLLPFVLLAFQSRMILTGNTSFVPALLIAFLCYSTILNLVYGLYLQSESFIFPVLHITYGLIIFVTTRSLIASNSYKNELNKYLVLSLVLLSVFAFLELGDFRFYPRYNAFFNDPNQMAFWCLCIGAMLLAQDSLRVTTKALIFALVFFIIMKSASRSGLIGYSFLVLGFSLNYLNGLIRHFSFKNLAIIFIGITICVGLGYYFIANNLESLTFIFDRVDQVDVNEQAEVRGYSRLLEFPEYLIFGAGQGDDFRFGGAQNEIHSTWAALLFYYGLPGLLSILAAIYSIAKGLDWSQKLIFLGPMLYSFSTLGYRTPIFWVLLGFFFVLSYSQRKNYESELSLNTT